MASNEMKIPTIDLTKIDLIKPGTEQWESTKTQVFEALQEYGCFEAVYDNVPREAIFDISKQIFEFPLETKEKCRSTIPMHGYRGHTPTLPLYESVGIADVLKPNFVESIVNIFWPNEYPDICNVLESYSKPLVQLTEMVKTMVLESLGLKEYMDEFLESYFFTIRLTHYNAAQDEDGDKPGLSAHTDYGFLTIISQNNINGLQVLKKNGEWIDVNLAPNSLFVLSADSLMAWTNGRLHSPIHMVILSDDSERLSIQLCSVPKSSYTIEAPKEVVDEEHPLLFKPYKFPELFAFRESEPGIRAGDADFKTFCAI